MHTFIKMTMLLFGGIVIPFSVNAQAKTVFNDVHFYESLAAVKEKISQDVLSHTVVEIDEPSFPLAQKSESHLLCTNIRTKNGTIAQVVFTFADDRLHYIEARGNAVNTLIAQRKDTADTYLDYKVYFKDGVFANMEKDIVWVLTKEAIHPNLFVWENPYLSKGEVVDLAYLRSGKIPEFIEMGGDLENLRPKLEANSLFVHEQELDGSDPNAQLQLNCFGVEYAGFPRKVEARFGDGKLNTVWILTGKGEEDRIRKKLVAHYGQPIFVNDAWEIFNNWTIGLRKDKPEVLLLTKELGQYYKTEYFKQ